MRARGLFKTFLSKQRTIFNLLSFLYLNLNMKRARTSGGSVTGGTGDVKPQIFTMDSGTAGAVNDYVVNRSILPVPRFGSMKTKATIFEILSVGWYLNIEDSQDVITSNWAFLTTSTTRADGDTATLASAALDVTDPRTFAFAFYGTNGAVARTQFPITINLTDSNGNGILIATDQLFIVGANATGTTGGSFIAKVKYRLTNVGIQEYIGIVQSQQG